MRVKTASASALLIYSVTAQIVTGQSVSQSGPDGSRIVVTGCVTQAQRTGSLAGTGVGAEATPNTAAKEANSGELLNAFLLNDAIRAPTPGAQASTNGPSDTARGASGERTAYALEGHEEQLAKYKGQRVEIAGVLMSPKPSATGSNSPALSAGIRRLRVESAKKVEGDACTAAPR